MIDVSNFSADTIKFRASVTLIEGDTGGEKMWQIVGEPEADAHTGNLSIASPIARQLIGKTKGDTVEVITPGANPKSGVELMMVGATLRPRHPQQPSTGKRATQVRGRKMPGARDENNRFAS